MAKKCNIQRSIRRYIEGLERAARRKAKLERKGKMILPVRYDNGRLDTMNGNVNYINKIGGALKTCTPKSA